MGIENKNNTLIQTKVSPNKIKELSPISPDELLDQINQTLLYNFADGSRPISHQEVLKLEETGKIIAGILESKKDILAIEFQGKNDKVFTLDLLTGIVKNEDETICQLARNEKSLLYGLISNPGKNVSKGELNCLIYPEQKRVAEISYQDTQRLQLIKSRLVKKLGKETGNCILTISGNGYLWDNGS